MIVTHQDIENAVRALKAEYPGLRHDALCVPAHPSEPATVEELIYDGIRHADAVQLCLDWLLACSKRATFNQKYDTRTYKGEVERHHGRWVSHSSMLIAVQLSGVEMQQSPQRPWCGHLKIGAKRPGGYNP